MSLLDKIISFKKAHRVVAHILFWIGVFLVSTADDSYKYNENVLSFNRFIFYCLTLITQILTAYFLAYFIIPRLLKTRHHITVFIFFLMGMYIICVLARMINIYIHEPLVGIAPKSFETFTEILTNGWKLLYVYFFRNFSIAVVFLFLKLLIDQYVIQNQKLTLEKQKAETELKQLKTQLNPHFLFNTLNNIYALSIISSPATSSAIARLSDILDHILYRCNTLYVPLASEISLLNNYIDLEKLRYNERLRVNFKTIINHEIEIAPLILLSIVENAFKHGASEDIGNAFVDIDLQVLETCFKFVVSNSFTPQIVHEAKNKIGLANLKHQLELIYPQQYSLAVEQTTSVFKVTLIINLQSDKS